jgi:AcrR family transcriptional regulator
MEKALKDQIIETSLQQFLKHGIKKMTVQKLVAPLSISTKTVYKYFTDKEDLLKICLTVHYQRLAKTIAAATGNTSFSPVIILLQLWREAIQLDFGVNHIFYHDLNYYYPRLQDAVMKKVFKKYPIELKEILDDGKRKGYFRKNTMPDVVLDAIEVLYANITRTGKFEGARLSPILILENTVEVYLRGLCTQKGLQELDQYNAAKKQ